MTLLPFHIVLYMHRIQMEHQFLFPAFHLSVETICHADISMNAL